MTDLKTAALHYHAHPRPGKLSVELTKRTATAQDLALAYSPGVAEGNMAVISNGTAILGLGDLGPCSFRTDATTFCLSQWMLD